MGDNLYHPCLELFKHQLYFLGDVAVQYFFNFIFLLFYYFSYTLKLSALGVSGVLLLASHNPYIRQSIKGHNTTVAWNLNFLIFRVLFKFYCSCFTVF